MCFVAIASEENMSYLDVGKRTYCHPWIMSSATTKIITIIIIDAVHSSFIMQSAAKAFCSRTNLTVHVNNNKLIFLTQFWDLSLYNGCLHNSITIYYFPSFFCGCSAAVVLFLCVQLRCWLVLRTARGAHNAQYTFFIYSTVRMPCTTNDWLLWISSNESRTKSKK